MPDAGDEPAPSSMRLAILDDRALLNRALTLLLEQGDKDSTKPVPIEVVYAGPECESARELSPDAFVVAVDSQGLAGERMAVDLARDGHRVLLFGSPVDMMRVRSAFDAGVLGLVPATCSVDDLHAALGDVASGSLHMTPLVAGILAGVSRTPELSPRELETLQLYAAGLKLRTVAHRLGISPHTAKEYLDRVREKYAVVGRRARTRTELFREAQRDGFVGGE